MLLVFVFRRFSPGVVLSVLGFSAWSLQILEIFSSVAHNPALNLNLIHIIVMSKVRRGTGMILLALEDELAKNATQERERRARMELEAYTNLILARRRVETLTARPKRSARPWWNTAGLPRPSCCLEAGTVSAGRFRRAGRGHGSGARRTGRANSGGEFLAPGSAPPAVDHSQTLRLDLKSWLKPGDDLKRLRFTSALAVPMTGRRTEGALLLAGMRAVQGNPPDSDIRSAPTTCCPLKCSPPDCKPRAARP